MSHEDFKDRCRQAAMKRVKKWKKKKKKEQNKRNKETKIMRQVVQ